MGGVGLVGSKGLVSGTGLDLNFGMGLQFLLQSVHNILRIFDVLLNFPFTTSETVGDYSL